MILKARCQKGLLDYGLGKDQPLNKVFFADPNRVQV